MRLSTSNFKYSVIFVLVFLILNVVPYIHFLMFAPAMRDLYGSLSRSDGAYYRDVKDSTVVFFRSECLAENVIQYDLLGLDDYTLTRDDRPWEFVSFLNNTKVFPKRIIVVEDTSFFIFYQTKKMKQTKNTDSEQGLKSFTQFVIDREEASNSADAAFISDFGRERKNLWKQPQLLRQYLENMADRELKRFLPTRARYHQHIHAFWREYLSYFKDLNPYHLFMAFSVYRHMFPFQKLQSELVDQYMPGYEFENAEVPEGYNPKNYFLADGYPVNKAEEKNYPAIEALKKAEANGSEIIFVILPRNPKYEKYCWQAEEPYYQALQGVCERNHWSLIDLRTTNTPQLKDFKVFRDHLHLYFKVHERKFKSYYEAVAKLLRERGVVPAN